MFDTQEQYRTKVSKITCVTFNSGFDPQRKEEKEQECTIVDSGLTYRGRPYLDVKIDGDMFGSTYRADFNNNKWEIDFD